MSGHPLPVVVTAAALTLALALEVTGPPQSFLFSLRLPVLVLAAGAVWAQAAWARAGWPRDAPRRRQPVPMATPCLVLTSTAVVAAGTVKLMSVSPTLACALLSVASAACCGAVGLIVTDGRPPRPPARAAATTP